MFQHFSVSEISPSTHYLHQISFCGPGAPPLRFTKREQDILFISMIHPREIFWKETIFSQMRPKMVLTCLRIETRSNIYYFWSFTMHSLSSSNSFFRPWCTFAPFYPKRAIYSVHLNDPSQGDLLKRSNFFMGETKNVVLTCLRLETRSNIHYFSSFIMHSISSSNFFCSPGALLLRFTLSEQNILFISKKVVLICLRLETRSNIHYFWSFTMHSLSSSNFFLRPRCNYIPFYSLREQVFLFSSVNHPRRIF